MDDDFEMMFLDDECGSDTAECGCPVEDCNPSVMEDLVFCRSCGNELEVEKREFPTLL